MKKFLMVSLVLCLLVAMVSSFAINTAAEEEISVSVGSRFEWNGQEDKEAQKAWNRSKGKSEDGLWKYQYYAFNLDVYKDLSASAGTGTFAWKSTPGDTGVGYARVRDHGKNFHPAELADVVKTFTCPKGGTIVIDTTVARQNEWVSGNGTPTSLAIYVYDGETDKLVYPNNGDQYVTLTSTTEETHSVEVEVAKNDLVHIRIGCIDGEQGGDGVNMSNTITYKSISDAVSEDVSDKTISQTNTLTRTDDLTNLTLTDNVVNPDLVDSGDDDDSSAGKPSIKVPVEEESSNMGLIIGIVAGAVVAAVVVVVVIIKKKK